MRRVYALYVFRQLTQPASMRLVLLVLSIGGLFSSVSVGQVVRNMPSLSDISGITAFYLSALTHTNVVVQFLFLLLCVSAILLIRDIVASLKNRLLVRSVA